MSRSLRLTFYTALLLSAAAAARADDLFTLQSPAFTDNGMMAAQYAGNDKQNPNCTGQNASPPLIWNNAPAQTQSLVLLVQDAEGNKGLGVTHLVAYNILPAASGFSPDALRDGKGFTSGKNTQGHINWYGPCPPPGSGAHHYIFTLIATSLPPTLPANLTRDALLAKIAGHQLAATGLIGRFGQ